MEKEKILFKTTDNLLGPFQTYSKIQTDKGRVYRYECEGYISLEMPVGKIGTFENWENYVKHHRVIQ